MYPKVSVIIPVYNASNFISSCIKNCLEQTFAETEFIFVDDKSTDNTIELIKPYAEAYPDKIRLIELPENKKQGNARNIGIENAKGDYIMFLDADDKYSISCVKKMYNKIIQDNSEMVVCKFLAIDDKTEDVVPEHCFSNFANIPEVYHTGFCHKDLPRYMIFDKSNVIWDKIYKKSFLIDNDIKFPVIDVCEDDVFSFKTLFRAKKITVLNENLYYYRINRKNSSCNLKNRNPFECFRMYELIKQDLTDLQLFDMYQQSHIHMKYHLYSFLFFYNSVNLIWRKEFFYKMQKELLIYQDYLNNADNKSNDLKTYELLSLIIKTKFYYLFVIKYFIYQNIVEEYRKQKLLKEQNKQKTN